jgi:hypothetical protein
MNEPITPPEDPETIPPGEPPYPLDVMTLVRGQDITESECARILGLKPNDKRWPFAMMALVGWIMHETEAAGDPLSACQRKGGIHINTDAEAAVYHVRNAERHEDGIRRNVGHMVRTVRTSALNDVQRLAHEQEVKLWALKLAALGSGRRALAPTPEQAKIETK